MKKLSTVLSLALALTALTACGDGQEYDATSETSAVGFFPNLEARVFCENRAKPRVSIRNVGNAKSPRTQLQIGNKFFEVKELIANRDADNISIDLKPGTAVQAVVDPRNQVVESDDRNGKNGPNNTVTVRCN